MQKSVLRRLICSFALGLCGITVGYLSLKAIEPQQAIAECNELLAQMNEAIFECSDMNDNWSCYGNKLADVDPIEYRYHEVRDRRPLAALNAITATNVITAINEAIDYGVVFVRLNVEGELEPMTAMLFGNTTLENNNAGAKSDTIEHNFLFAIDDMDLACVETPSGMIVQTEEGVAGSLTLNEVTIELKSTAFVTMDDKNVMTIVNVEGIVSAIVDGVRYVIPMGGELRIDQNNRPLGPPTANSRWAKSIVLRRMASLDTSSGDRDLNDIYNTNADKNSEEACIGGITLNAPIKEKIQNRGHECLYSLCLNQQAPVTVRLEADLSKGSTLNPWLDIRNPTGKLVAVNNDADGTDRNSRLCNVVLPATEAENGCHTIVARSYRNLTEGDFVLSVEPGGACEDPQPRCEVLGASGIGLYDRPDSLSGPTKLPQHTQLLILNEIERTNWTEVQVLSESSALSGQSGYIYTDPKHVLCEFVADPPPPPTVIPSVTVSTTVIPPTDTPVTETPETVTPDDPPEPNPTDTPVPTATSTSTPIPPPKSPPNEGP